VTWIKGDDKWFTVCNVILGAAKDGLTMPVNRYLITTGQIAWDDCCDGQLAVSFTRTSPTEAFPTEQVTLSAYSESGSCTPPYEIGEITVQITRCTPQALNGQSAPSPDKLTAHAKQNLIDANQIRRSVAAALCTLHEDYTTQLDYFIRSQLMLGPEGGCDGSELYLYAGLTAG
jgi:hypothetical protein